MIGGWSCCQHQHHIKLNCNQTQARTHHLSASDVEIISGIGMAQAKNLWVQMFLCLIQSSHFQITDQILEWMHFIHKVQIIILWMKSSVMLTNLSTCWKISIVEMLFCIIKKLQSQPRACFRNQDEEFNQAS